MLVESYEVEEIARLIAQHRPTTMFGSDDMIARLLELVPGEQPFPSVKWVGYAGFNAALENIAEIAEARGLILRGLYGMSEVQALYALQPLDAPVGARKKGGGMLGSPFAHVRVRDPETGELLGVGQPGALECAGPSLMVGYYGNEKATAESITPDGYVRTGDLAQLDGHGGFTFLSRMGDVLRLSGFLVNPLEIETHIQKLPGIEGCQTIAVARPEGVRAVSFVMLKPGAALDEAERDRPLQARPRQLQGAAARLRDRRLPQDALAQRPQDPAHQAAATRRGSPVALSGTKDLTLTTQHAVDTQDPSLRSG